MCGGDSGLRGVAGVGVCCARRVHVAGRDEHVRGEEMYRERERVQLLAGKTGGGV